MSALLTGLAEVSGFDPRGCEAFVGTSAGSIVAASLANGVEPHARLGELPEQPPVPEAESSDGDSYATAGALQLATAVGRATAAPFAALGLRAAEPGGALLRRAALSRLPAGRRSLGGLGERIDQRGAAWDGRLLVATVDLASGRRVMFGAPGAPAASVGQAVEASCAIPGVFRPIEIGGRQYVDGGAWSGTNMDAAPVRRGTRVLCLNPTGALRLPLNSPFGVFATLSRSLAAVEVLALERHGAKVRNVAPDTASAEAMGSNLMDPGRRPDVIAAGLAQGRALGR
jgi:NTE family protein